MATAYEMLCGVVFMGGRLEIFQMQGAGRGFIGAMACPLASQQRGGGWISIARGRIGN